MIEKIQSPALGRNEKSHEIILSKANEIAFEIDSDLSVKLVDGKIFTSKGEQQSGQFLTFVHGAIPSISWSMEIPHNTDYLKDKFREVVEEIYEKQQQTE